jgi:ADP-ribose pyrophosphatase YjhB (NUDIX family)
MIHTARAVIFNAEGQLLLIERRKDEEHYFVLPGGQVQDGESAEQAVMREVKEETTLVVAVIKELYANIDELHNHQTIFLCGLVKGSEPRLPPGSQEAQKAFVTGQEYKPAWRSPEFLRDETMYPTWLLEQLETDMLEDFAENPKVVAQA